MQIPVRCQWKGDNACGICSIFSCWLYADIFPLGLENSRKCMQSITVLLKMTLATDCFPDFFSIKKTDNIPQQIQPQKYMNFSNIRHEYEHFHWNLKKVWNFKLQLYSDWPQGRCFRLIFLKSELRLLLKVHSIDVNLFGVFKMQLPWSSNIDFEHMKQLLLFLLRYTFCKFIFNESNKLLVILSNISVRNKELLFLFYCFFCLFLPKFQGMSESGRMSLSILFLSLPFHLRSYETKVNF